MEKGNVSVMTKRKKIDLWGNEQHYADIHLQGEREREDIKYPDSTLVENGELHEEVTYILSGRT